MFALSGQDLEIDRIPLAEIEFLKEFQGIESDGNGAATKRRTSRMLQIATNQQGLNSGRTYYLRVESETFDDLLRTWSELARKARRRAEAQTLFKKVQREVRAIYDASLFQTCVALMIAAVRSLISPNNKCIPASKYCAVSAELRVLHSRGAARQPGRSRQRRLRLHQRRQLRTGQPHLHDPLHRRVRRPRLRLLAPPLPHRMVMVP